MSGLKDTLAGKPRGTRHECSNARKDIAGLVVRSRYVLNLSGSSPLVSRTVGGTPIGVPGAFGKAGRLATPPPDRNLVELDSSLKL